MFEGQLSFTLVPTNWQFSAEKSSEEAVWAEVTKQYLSMVPVPFYHIAIVAM